MLNKKVTFLIQCLFNEVLTRRLIKLFLSACGFLIHRPIDPKSRRNDNKAIDLDDAIAETGHGKFHYLVLFISGLCLMSVIVEILDTGYLLPAAQCDLQLTTQDKGTLNAMVFVGMIVSSHLWGFLADTRGRRRILIITLLVNACCTIVSSFSHSLWLYLVMRFLNGVFICGPSAIIYAYLGEFNSSLTRSKAIVWACTFVSVGMMTLPGLAWLIIPQPWNIALPWMTYSSWRIFLALCAIPGLVTAILLITCLPESPKFLLSQGNEKEALAVLRMMFIINTGKSVDKYPVHVLKTEDDSKHQVSSQPRSVTTILSDMWNQTWPLFLPPHLLNTLLACTLQFGLFSSSNGIILWMPDLFNRLSDYTQHFPDHNLTVCQIAESGIAVINETSLDDVTIDCRPVIDMTVYQNTLIIGSAGALAYLMNGYFIGCMGRKYLLITNLLISGCSGIGLYFVKTSAELLALSCLFLALSATCIGLVGTAVVELFPTHLRAMAVCISLMMGRLGTVLASVMVGLLIEINCGSVFFVVGGIVISCGLLGFFLPNTKHNVR